MEQEFTEKSYINPDAYPDSYEAGTVNMPAIWALKTAIEFIEAHYDQIRSEEDQLLHEALSKLRRLDRVILYRPDVERVPTFCFNIEGIPSSAVVERLDEQRNMCAWRNTLCYQSS